MSSVEENGSGRISRSENREGILRLQIREKVKE